MESDSAARRSLHPEASVQGADPILKLDEGLGLGCRLDLDDEHAVPPLDGRRRGAPLRGLRDEDVGRCLDGRREPLLRQDSETDVGLFGKGLQCGAQAFVREHRRMDAMGDVSQLDDRTTDLALSRVEARGKPTSVVFPSCERMSRNASDSPTRRC